jgi:hypothetical protein
LLDELDQAARYAKRALGDLEPPADEAAPAEGAAARPETPPADQPPAAPSSTDEGSA